LRTAAIVSRTATGRAIVITCRDDVLRRSTQPFIVVAVTTRRMQQSHISEPESIAAWKIAAIWTIPALLSTVETVMFARLGGHPIATWRAFVGEAPQWFGWAALTPAIIGLGDRYPLRRPVRLPAIAVHAAASLGASLVLAFCDALVNAWVRPSPGSLLATARNWFLGGLPATTLVYFAIIVASYAWRSSARLRRREREAAELQTQLRDAQLGALRMQLQPHFLFNSLNAVMALVRDHDTKRALHALSLLSDVLRATVNSGNAHETTLASEIDFVTRYLGIEQVRFGERLRVIVDVPADLNDARVPVFILQPFVENSLKHGVLRERQGNEIVIRARRQAASLVLEVIDDGRGLASSSGAPAGVGIANARARVDRMYGADASVSVHDAPEGRGVAVEITLPLVRGSAQSQAAHAAPVELAV
jgi:two-component system, LytTR family, sensor kinase